MKQLFFTILALLISNSAYAQVKATSAEINTGTDDDKFATALALQGSKYLDQNGGKLSAVTAAGANTYTANIAPAITGYSSGQVFYVKITTANTGVSTLNLNGLGAKTLVKDATTPLIAGDLLANKVYAVYYDGTNFQVMNGGVIGTNTGDQTLSLGTGAGNIAISNGNNVSLKSLWVGAVTDYPDGNVKPSTAGVYPYVTTTGSTNYPIAEGGGIKFTRSSASTQGHFEFYKAANNLNEVYFRGGTGTTTFGAWDIIAGRNWVNSQFYTQAQTNLGFVKIGTTGGYAAADPNIDLNTVTTNNVFYIGSASTNAPISGGGMIQSLGRNSVYSAQTMLGNSPDSWFYRSQNNGVWSSWNQVASRSWVSSQIPGVQMLSTSGLSGNISISGANSIALTSLFPNATTIFPDANVLPTAAGFYPYNTTSGSSNYPESAGSGFKSSRSGGSGFGYFELFKAAGNDGNTLYLRSGTGTGTTTPFEKIATQNWATSNFAAISGAAYLPLTGGTLTAAVAAKLILKKTNALQGNYIDFASATGVSEGYVGLGSSANTNLALVARLGNDLILGSNNSIKLTITPTEIQSLVQITAPSIGIGTTNVHNYKLAVGGGIIAESVKVKPQGSWPDYVFEKDYPILPLNELEKFVLKNKHLPDVPNAAEVKKDGIDMGEMNAKLLQKIEELTLYIIEQQKSIVGQQLGISDQKKEINDLRGKLNEMAKLSEVVGKLSTEIDLIKNKQ